VNRKHFRIFSAILLTILAFLILDHRNRVPVKTEMESKALSSHYPPEERSGKTTTPVPFLLEATALIALARYTESTSNVFLADPLATLSIGIITG
jgi:hypothetical protein